MSNLRGLRCTSIVSQKLKFASDERCEAEGQEVSSTGRLRRLVCFFDHKRGWELLGRN
jgi:hypothetical protein